MQSSEEKKEKIDGNLQKSHISISDVIVEDAKSQEERQTQKKLVEGVYVFISFDLINSTVFKGRHKKTWPAFVSSFYETVFDDFGLKTGVLSEDCVDLDNEKKKIDRPFGTYNFEMYSKEILKTNGFHLWKLLGDEVLIYHKVNSAEELYATIQFVDYKRKNIVEKAINKCLKTLYPDKNANVEVREEKEERRILLKQYFNVKTAMWIGNCAYDYRNINTKMPNAIYGTEYNEEADFIGGEFDFLGPDIDEGFRLSACSERGVMLVSPKLLRLLMVIFNNNSDRLNALIHNFKIANYISLKGVWEQRPYPLIMFCQSKAEEVDSIDAWKCQFEYDAFENSFLYKNIDKYGKDFLHDPRFSVMNLEKIYQDMKREKEITDLQEQIERQSIISYEKIQFPKLPSFEYHISCLCRDKDGKYWITKHATHGWSFGCVEVKTTEYCGYVKEAYALKYKLKIEIDNNSPILCFYTAKRSEDKGGTSILGTIILGELIERSDDKEIESKLLSYDECMSEFVNEHKIDGFESALHKAEELVKNG